MEGALPEKSSEDMGRRTSTGKTPKVRIREDQSVTIRKSLRYQRLYFKDIAPGRYKARGPSHISLRGKWILVKLRNLHRSKLPLRGKNGRFRPGKYLYATAEQNYITNYSGKLGYLSYNGTLNSLQIYASSQEF